MKMLSDARLRLDIAKLLFLAGAVAGAVFLMAINPALSTPAFLAVVFGMILSPYVAFIERRGVSRALSITIVFGIIGLAFGAVAFWAAASFQAEWVSFKIRAPQSFSAAILELRKIEASAKLKYAFLDSAHPTDSLLAWGQELGRTFAENGAAWAQSALTWILLVPPLTFVALNDGRSVRQRFFQLVPNRFFESFFLVSNDITTAISDYLRAKLIEALLVGIMTTAGLLLVDAPYAFVLGIVAGITNIIPYAGPVLGLIPALLAALFDQSGQGLLWPVMIVYVVTNVIDTIVIFPIVVAKLVNMHPLILIAVVAIGGQYYGLVGMLVSTPIATACKVIITEVYLAIYEQRASRRTSSQLEEVEQQEEVA